MRIRNLVFTALCIALGVVLPMAFHSIPNSGSILLPMHIPVLLSGLIAGPIWGLACGIITPMLASILTGMPPAAILPGMVCELAVYGLMTGVWFQLLNKVGKKLNFYVKMYIALIGAMICGRIIYGVLNALIFRAGAYSVQIWLTASFVTALPGIVIQLIVIPVIVIALKKAALIGEK